MLHTNLLLAVKFNTGYTNLLCLFSVVKTDEFTRRLFEIHTKVLDDNKQVSCILKQTFIKHTKSCVLFYLIMILFI